MSRIVVTYEDGHVWTCDVEAVGDGDAGRICAAATTVGLRRGALIYAPQVLLWSDGSWTQPTGVSKAWTSTNTGFIDRNGIAHDLKEGQVYSTQETIARRYPQACYTLLTATQLADAISVTVDGTLAYTREGGKLVPVPGGGATTDSGLSQEFDRDASTPRNSPFDGLFAYNSSATHARSGMER